MLTKIKKISVLVMFAVFVFVLAGCKSELDDALKGLAIPLEVSEDFTLPSATLKGAVTTWTSSDEETIKITDGTYAEVFRPHRTDKKVTLTATVTLAEETKNKKFEVKVLAYEAPNEIAIDASALKYDEANEAFLIKKGSTAQLKIEVADENMSTEVTWSVSKKARATISEDGLLTAVDFGELRVIATSTSSSAEKPITAQINVIVVEDTNHQQVLLNAKKEIESQIPEFIYKETEFPSVTNEEVKVTYTDILGNEFTNGIYEYSWDPEYSVDCAEVVYCVLSYLGQEHQFEFVVYVVGDKDNNEFLAIKYAEEELDKVLSQYVVGGTDKVRENVNVPLKLTHTIGDVVYDLELKYDIETDYKPNPVSVGTIAEGAESVDLIYTKPNDDANSNVIIYCKTANNDKTIRYNVVAEGYTEEEKIEYIKNNVLPQPNADGVFKLECQHVMLPSADTTGKFRKLEIEWKSSDTSVLSDAGKYVNFNLAEQTDVTLTATIKYAGTVSGRFGFEKTVDFLYEVYPAANKAQSIALQISNYVDAPEFYDTIKYYPFGKKDRLDADGNIDNVLHLPSKVSELTSELAEYADLEITWASAEADLFDENFKLLKQYLRYHEVVLTYSVKYEENGVVNEASAEVVINVGLAEVKNTVYIGGPGYQSTASDASLKGDVLPALSKFDAPVNTLSKTYRTWGGTAGVFSGITFYVDVYEKDDEGNIIDETKFTRYQYYVSDRDILALDEKFKIYLADEADPTSAVLEYNEELNPNITKITETNWHVIFRNVSDQDIKIPLSPLANQKFLNKEDVKWDVHPWNKKYVVGRDNAVSIDGYRPGFVTDGEGNVIHGNGEDYFQATYEADGDGQLTEADYWITIPAKGYAFTPRSQQNGMAALFAGFCTIGNKITFLEFDPYHLSPDGSSEELGSYVHE